MENAILSRHNYYPGGSILSIDNHIHNKLYTCLLSLMRAFLQFFDIIVL
jgi:hypothetical protein